MFVHLRNKRKASADRKSPTPNEEAKATSRLGQSGCHWASPAGTTSRHFYSLQPAPLPGSGGCPQMPELTSPACRGICSPPGEPSLHQPVAGEQTLHPLTPEQDKWDVGPALSSETRCRTWLHTPSLLGLLLLTVPCHTPGLPGSIHSKLTCMRVLVSRLHLGNPARGTQGS